MEIQVLFAERNATTGAIEHYDHVANVDAPEHYHTERALEYAFRRLQNIDDSWSLGPTVEFEPGAVFYNADYDPNVTVVKPLPKSPLGREYGHRSCSIGDRMLIADKIFEVDSFGFRELI